MRSRLAMTMCKDPEFWAFAKSRSTNVGLNPPILGNAVQAEGWIRGFCHIGGLIELDTDYEASKRFDRMERAFRDYKNGRG